MNLIGVLYLSIQFNLDSNCIARNVLDLQGYILFTVYIHFWVERVE